MTMLTRRLLFPLLWLGLCACTTKVVTMEELDTFPTPLIEPLPVHVGVHFPPEFGNFSYNEKRPGPGGQDWTISIGPTQLQVFRELFTALFERLDELEAPSSENPQLAAVIVPSVAEFQFALPADTKAKVFEIWVKYDLSVRDPQGAEIGHWQFTAYGKTPTAFLKSDEEAIRAATIVAMRDAGASLVSGIQRDPRLREWLGIEPSPPPPATQALRVRPRGA